MRPKWITNSMLFLLVFFGFKGYGQFEKTFVNKTSNEVFTNLVSSTDGTSTIAVGYTQNPISLIKNIAFAKIDATGNRVWSRYLPQTGNFEPHDLIKTSDNGYVMVGQATNAGNTQLYICRFNEFGNITWQRVYTGASESVGYGVAEMEFTGFPTIKLYVVVGYEETATNGKDMLVITFGINGGYGVSSRIGSIGDDILTGIATYDDKMVVVGKTDIRGTEDVVLGELGNQGTGNLFRFYDGGQNEEAVGIHIVDGTTSEGNKVAYLSGHTNSFGDNDQDIFRIITHTNRPLFTPAFGQRVYDFGGVDVLNNQAGVFYYSGYTSDTVTGQKKGILLHTDGIGNNEGSRLLSSCTGDFECQDYYSEVAGQIKASIQTTSTASGFSDFMIAQYPDFGLVENDPSCMSSALLTQPTDEIFQIDTSSTLLINTSTALSGQFLTPNYNPITTNWVFEDYCDTERPICVCEATEILSEENIIVCSFPTDVTLPNFGNGSYYLSDTLLDTNVVTITSESMLDLRLQRTSDSACVKTQNIQVLPVEFDLPDTVLCSVSEPLLLSGPDGYDTYSWSLGSITKEQSVSSSGDYSVMASISGCSHTDNFKVSISSNKQGLFSASKRANIWYFGQDAGLDFNTDPPTAIRGSQINVREGISIMSDQDGNLQFYTDGRTVWTKDHFVMSNGTGLKGDPSSTHSGLIIPHPGNPDLYYLFTVPSIEGNGVGTGLNYNVIDLSLQAGNGQVTIKNQLLHTPTTEKLTAVESEDKKTIWLISHKSGGSNEFLVYKIDATGLTTTPVVSSVGRLHGDVLVNNFGQMKVTPQGDKLALALGNQGFEVFDFDNATGRLSNPWYVDDFGGGAVGTEFSPNGQFVYFTDYLDDGIHQYEVDVANEQEFRNSHVEIGTISSNSNGRKEGMQLGPDGKIYVNENLNTAYVHAILDPNEKGDAANFELNYIFLNGGRAILRFPNLMPSYLKEIEPIEIIGENLCSGESTQLTTNSNFTDIMWDFGDLSNTMDQDNGPVVTYTYPSSGTYSVTISYNSGCQNSTGDVVISNPISSNSKDTITACAVSTELNPGNIGGTFEWYGEDVFVDLLSMEQVLSVNENGEYHVVITNNTCLDTINYQVYLESLPSLGVNSTLYNCFEDQDLTITIGPDPKSYTWLVNSESDVPLIVNVEGTYQIVVQGDSICKDTLDILVLNQCEGILYLPNAFTPNGDNKNDLFKPFTKFLTAYRITIFNQWGEIVFVSEDEKTHWDGVYRDQLQLGGAYSYLVKYSYEVEGKELSQEKKGYLTLIR